MIYQSRTSTGVLPTTWLGRLITMLLAAALAVVGLFFVAFALIAAAIVAAIVALRVWWVMRKLRAQKDQDVIEGSYSVETERTLAVQSSTIDDDTPNPPAPK